MKIYMLGQVHASAADNRRTACAIQKIAKAYDLVEDEFLTLDVSRNREYDRELNRHYPTTLSIEALIPYKMFAEIMESQCWHVADAHTLGTLTTLNGMYMYMPDVVIDTSEMGEILSMRASPLPEPVRSRTSVINVYPRHVDMMRSILLKRFAIDR